MVAGLDQLGLRENTLVLFYSDNGTHLEISSTLKGKEVRGEGGGDVHRQREPEALRAPGAAPVLEKERLADVVEAEVPGAVHDYAGTGRREAAVQPAHLSGRGLRVLLRNALRCRRPRLEDSSTQTHTFVRRGYARCPTPERRAIESC
mgnify:CR=1 FL=1